MKRITFLFIFMSLFIAVFSHADDYYWNNPAGGELGDSTRWNPTGPPGEDDYVYFNLPNTYTIWLDDYYTHDKLHVEGSDLTLDLNGYEYILDTTDDYYQSVIIGDYVPSSLTLSGGSVHCGDIFTGRNSSAAVGTLNVSGEGTMLSGFLDMDYSWHGFFFGTLGDSVVRVTDGAYMEHGHGQSGIYGSAQFLIDGENTQWYVDGSFGMSAYGTTTADITNGAWTRFGKLDMGYDLRSSAVINVTGLDQNTALTVENWWEPISLYLGMNGKGIINLQEAYLYTISSVAIASGKSGYGELNIYDNSYAEILGSLGIGGTPDQPGGQGLLTLYDDPANWESADLVCSQEAGEFLVVWPDGTIRMDGGTIYMDAQSPANPIILKGGLLEGWGNIYAEVDNESGTVMPGVAGLYKVFTLYYNYEQGPAGTLKIGIGGTTAEWDYSVLKVNDAGYGQVTLDGFLDVDLLADFVPEYDDEFVIIEAQSVSGQFINAPSEYVFEDGTFEVIYATDCVVLTHFEEQPQCPAFPAVDYNKDCLVNLVDLAVFAEAWLTCNLEPDTFCPGIMPM